MDYGLGTCSEYLEEDVMVNQLFAGYNELFAGYNKTLGKLTSVPDSEFCEPDPVGLWLELAGLGTLLLFLLRQRRINRSMAEASDQEQISAAGLHPNPRPSPPSSMAYFSLYLPASPYISLYLTRLLWNHPRP